MNGEVYIKGHCASGSLSFYGVNKRWTVLDLPEDIANNVPATEGEIEQNGCYLIRDFVKDIQGESVALYQTLREGSQYQQLIDLIRENRNWTDVSHLA